MNIFKDKSTLLSVIIVVLLLYLIFVVGINFYCAINANNHYNFENRELETSAEEKKEKIVNIKNKHNSAVKEMVSSSVEGVLRGLLIGGITDGWRGAVTMSAIFGTVNPLIARIKHKSPSLK
jgi:hypothetical protein